MRNSWPLTIMAALFVAPMLAASYMLAHADHATFNTVEHGVLIQPSKVIEFKGITLTTKKWNLVYMAPATCDMDCQNQKQILSKLHDALGKERERVNITSATSDMIATRVKDGSMLLIDPFGRYIMYYAPDSNPSGLLKDLKRLLKYSHV